MKTRSIDTASRPGALRRARGIALLDVLGALAIGAILVGGVVRMMDTSLEDVRGQQAAYYQSQLADAAQRYIAANGASLQGSLPSASSIVAVGVAQLIADHVLSANTGGKNGYGQTPCLLIRQPDPAARPGQFDALLATGGGAPIPDRILAVVGANAGAGGGYIAGADTGTAKGASWSTATTAYRGAACAGGTALTGGAADGGHLASNLFFNGPGQSAADFLYRSAVPGRPELNRMNTPVRMAGAALVAAGASCLNAAGAAEAGMAIDASTRGVLVCSAAGVWTSPSHWKEPVPTYAGLPAVGNASGDVRMVSALARAFSWDGSGWKALAVDQNGDMAVPGTLNAADLHAGQAVRSDGTMYAAGDMSTGGSVSAALDVNATRTVNGQDVIASRNMVTQGLEVDRWASSPAVTIGINTFVAGAACHYMAFDAADGTSRIRYPMGTVVMDANYVPLICGADKTMRYANGTYSP